MGCGNGETPDSAICRAGLVVMTPALTVGEEQRMKKIAHCAFVQLLLVAAAFLPGCSAGTFTQSPVPSTATQNPATAVVVASASTPTIANVVPTNALVQPTPRSAASPTPSSTAMPPSPTQAPPTPPSAASPTSAEMTVQIFLIGIGDNGKAGAKIGCGDSAIPVQVRIPYTLGVLRASLEKLLSTKERTYGSSGLYNSLYQSDLHVASLAMDAGKATIRLTGTLSLGGECDSPRVEAQLKQTALQFSTVQDIAIFLNDRPLADVLSLK